MKNDFFLILCYKWEELIQKHADQQNVENNALTEKESKGRNVEEKKEELVELPKVAKLLDTVEKEEVIAVKEKTESVVN